MAQILIIDDDAAVRSVLGRMLTRQGHEVTELADGSHAIGFLRAGEGPAPDLIITDMYMPEMDGIEFLIKLADVAPDIPAIAISGGGVAGSTHVLEDAEFLGAAATLSKPFSPDQVRQVVSEVLATSG